MIEIRDENHWTDPKTGIRYKADDGASCLGCALLPFSCPHKLDGPFCSRFCRGDGRDVIWVRDDQPEMTAASDSAPDGTVSMRIGRPAPLLALTPPICLRDLLAILTALHRERLFAPRLTVSIEDEAIVVREEQP